MAPRLDAGRHRMTRRSRAPAVTDTLPVRDTRVTSPPGVATNAGPERQLAAGGVD